MSVDAFAQKGGAIKDLHLMFIVCLSKGYDGKKADLMFFI